MMSAKKNRMLQFEAGRVMWDPIGAKNTEREREKTKRIGNDIKRVCV